MCVDANAGISDAWEMLDLDMDMDMGVLPQAPYGPGLRGTACQTLAVLDQLEARVGSADDQGRECWAVFEKPLRTSGIGQRRIHYRIISESGGRGVSVSQLNNRWDMFQAIVGALNGE